ncbi:glycosyltransferase [Alteromonas gracilis]|uniref:glycosyltransferase family 2 protein n=1 Tax=Alteromonas gracilis TaxID=1479524 RepID=UPI0036F22820
MKYECPRVSVIVPYYNRQAFLPSLIQCLNEQTFKSFEVLFIDDCSEIPLHKSIEFGVFDINFSYKILRNSINLGVSESRNIGITQSQGEYICFLDSDDGWTKEKLDRCVQECEKLGQEIKVFLMSKTTVITGERRYSLPNISRFEHHSGEDYLFRDGLFAQVSSFFLSRSLASTISFNSSLRQYEDFLYFIDAYNQAEERVFVQDSLVEWENDQSRSDRLSNQKSYQQAQDFMQVLESQSDKSSINNFYMRFVLPYSFYSNKRSSIKHIKESLLSQNLTKKQTAWLTIRAILGERAIAKLRDLFK